MPLCHCIEFGDTRPRLLVGEVLVFHIRDGLLANGKVDTLELDPVARLAEATAKNEPKRVSKTLGAFRRRRMQKAAFCICC